MWNFTQNIFYGLPNSGIVSLYSVFKLDAASSGFFFDPVFGVEGSIGAVLLLTIALVCFVVYAKRHAMKPYDLWAERDLAVQREKQLSLATAKPGREREGLSVRAALVCG